MHRFAYLKNASGASRATFVYWSLYSPFPLHCTTVRHIPTKEVHVTLVSIPHLEQIEVVKLQVSLKDLKL